MNQRALHRRVFRSAAGARLLDLLGGPSPLGRLVAVELVSAGTCKVPNVFSPSGTAPRSSPGEQTRGFFLIAAPADRIELQNHDGGDSARANTCWMRGAGA